MPRGRSRKQFNPARAVLPVAAGVLFALAALLLLIHIMASGTRASRPDTKSAEPFSGPIIAGPVAIIGDSYAASAGASKSGNGFVPILVKTYEWPARNFSVGGTGYTTSGSSRCGSKACPSYLETIPEIAKFEPNTVLVFGGRNDTETPSPAMRTDVQDFYRKLRQSLPEAQIVAFSPIWDNTHPPPALKGVAKAVRKGVTSVRGRYVDLHNALLGRPDLISSDGVHPNDAGHRYLAQVIEDILGNQ